MWPYLGRTRVSTERTWEPIVFPAHALLIVEERLKEQEAEGVQMPAGMERDELALRILIAVSLPTVREATQCQEGRTMDRLSVVERGYEAVAAGDGDALQELFTDDAVWQLMDRTEVVKKFEGREAVVEYLLQLRDMRLEAITAVRDVVVTAHSFTSRSGERVIGTTLYEVPQGLCAIAYCSEKR